MRGHPARMFRATDQGQSSQRGASLGVLLCRPLPGRAAPGLSLQLARRLWRDAGTPLAQKECWQMHADAAWASPRPEGTHREGAGVGSSTRAPALPAGEGFPPAHSPRHTRGRPPSTASSTSPLLRSACSARQGNVKRQQGWAQHGHDERKQGWAAAILPGFLLGDKGACLRQAQAPGCWGPLLLMKHARLPCRQGMRQCCIRRGLTSLRSAGKVTRAGGSGRMCAVSLSEYLSRAGWSGVAPLHRARAGGWSPVKMCLVAARDVPPWLARVIGTLFKGGWRSAARRRPERA